ncbi:MAG TPA: hypothetical protein VK464_25280 [Symbiobacteriaceae bacterium]|jgi:hypothetical protein|nr:hypothetical protein [Symbiobacteriaceae bacterium]
MSVLIDSIFRPELVAERVLTAPDEAERSQMTRLAYILSVVAVCIAYLWILLPALFMALLSALAGDVLSIPRLFLQWAFAVVGTCAGVYAVLTYTRQGINWAFTQFNIKAGTDWVEKLNRLLPYHLAGAGAVAIVYTILPVLGFLAGLAITVYALSKWWKVYRDLTQLEVAPAVVSLVVIGVLKVAPGYVLDLALKILT